MRKYKLFKVVKILMIAVVALFVFGFVTMGLWNALIPAIFGLKTITFWQALGLLLLGKILFGGFHRHGGGRPGWRRHMEARFANMTPEEREQFRSGMRNGSWCRPRASVPTTEPTSL